MGENGEMPTENRPAATPAGAELRRLAEDARKEKNWKRWGSYLSERQWGTVREDYSPCGTCWEYFPHDHARSRVYRSGEDGLLGLCDRECRLCFAIALWNGKDPILKERFFGLSNREGNHGEDVKECYFYLDATPTHSYQKALYKYPQAEFPYTRLVEENRRRTRQESEFELLDTGIFEENRYFDVLVEYAKAGPDDILIRITATNRGPDSAALHLLPTLWLRNTWAWGRNDDEHPPRGRIAAAGDAKLLAEHATLGRFCLAFNPLPNGQVPELLFTENETNFMRVFGVPNTSRHVKDAFHEYLIHGTKDAVSSAEQGTKAAVHYLQIVPPGEAMTIELRLFAEAESPDSIFGPVFARTFADRIREADDFYAAKLPAKLSAEEKQVARQAYAGLLWSKQYYEYIVKDWMESDPAQLPPPPQRLAGRNSGWTHLHARDVLVMPDNWEYPWFAVWDHAFQMVTLAEVDPELAKQQLLLFLREWYMHPNGHVPAHEFGFSDVNPPVLAWACWRVYKMGARRGQRDRLFLERAVHKLLICFTWWVNRKDPLGRNLFTGGFLGLDNISALNRSAPLPEGASLTQADATAWVAFLCTTLLAMTLELAHEDPAYEDVASKFFEHFVSIQDAINSMGGSGLWDEADGFYYDAAQISERTCRLKIRSMVGLVPLFAVECIEQDVIDCLPGFKKRMNWFLIHRPDLKGLNGDASKHPGGAQGRRILALVSRDRLERILRYVFSEEEFLSPYGIRSLSRFHKDHPFVMNSPWGEFRADYEPGESVTGIFGGNSNWRGPVWFPVNYLLIEALQRYHHFYGESLRVELPVGSGRTVTLSEAAAEISARLTRLFLPDAQHRRPCHGTVPRFASDPPWRDLVLFYEYFHGKSGRGCGASHQTGWTALVARLLQKTGAHRGRLSQ